MIGNTKPNFKMKNCGNAERRTKNGTVAKLYLSDLKRSLAESEFESGPVQAFESIGEIMAKRKSGAHFRPDHDGQVSNGVNPKQGV